MPYELTVTFPMRIDASPLFRTLYDQAAEWRAQLDLNNVKEEHIRRLRQTRAPELPRLQDRSRGQKVNILA